VETGVEGGVHVCAHEGLRIAFEGGRGCGHVYLSMGKEAAGGEFAVFDTVVRCHFCGGCGDDAFQAGVKRLLKEWRQGSTKVWAVMR